MKVLIVDDEPLARTRLKDILSDIGDINVVGEAANGLEALEQIQNLNPDIVLLDIRMPVMTGLEAARHMSELNEPPAVIFTTAYDDHALEAFDAHAIDYLLKPIRMARLEQALQKSRALTRSDAEAVNKAIETQEGRTHICAHHRGNLILVPVQDILFFQADNKYVVVRHANGEVLIDESLKSLEDEFNGRFTRIHRNALVANNYIKTLEKASDGHHYLHLDGVEEGLAVSRRQLSVVRKVVAGLGSLT